MPQKKYKNKVFSWAIKIEKFMAIMIKKLYWILKNNYEKNTWMKINSEIFVKFK